MRSALTDGPIDSAALVAEVAHAANGATLLFIGTVRNVNDNRAVTGIEYSAYRPMAEREIYATDGLAAVVDDRARKRENHFGKRRF